MKGDLSDLKKIRAGQAISPYEKGVSNHDEYFQYGNDKILVRYYYPDKCTKPSDLPIFIFIHGGGWCHSSVEQRNYMLSRLSLLSNITVASIDFIMLNVADQLMNAIKSTSILSTNRLHPD